MNADQCAAKIRGYVIDLSRNSQRGSLELRQRLKLEFMDEILSLRISEIDGKSEVMLTIDIFVALRRFLETIQVKMKSFDLATATEEQLSHVP